MKGKEQDIRPSNNSESQNFTRNIIWMSIAQILISSLSIVVLPALTKSYNTETYGIWTQANVTSSLVAPLLTLGLCTAVVRFLAGEEDRAKRRRSLGSMLFAIIIFTCLFLMAANFYASQISVFLFASSAFTTYVRLTIFWILGDALYIFFGSYLRARGNILKLSIIQAIYSVIRMVLIVTLATTGFGLQWIIISQIITDAILISVILVIIIRDVGFPTPNLTYIKGFLVFSIPDMPSGILLWIISTSDRYFITHFLDLSQTGIYSTSNSLGGLISLFFSPVSYVLLPTISKLWEQNRQVDVKNYLEYSTKLFLTLAVPAAVGITILSQPLLKILTTSNYLVGRELVLLIAIGTIFQGIYLINVYIIYLVKQTKWLPLMIIIASATCVVINFVLIPRIGITGAAIANIISYFVLAGIVTIWARKTVAYSFDFKYLCKIILAALIMALCLYYIKANTASVIILTIVAGTTIYFISLLLMRAFSKQDRQLFKQTLSGFIPKLH